MAEVFLGLSKLITCRKIMRNHADYFLIMIQLLNSKLCEYQEPMAGVKLNFYNTKSSILIT